MTDNYNDDYREVIPEEEKTETTLSENRDNEKNSDDTQVVDTAGENSAEKKTEDKKDSSESVSYTHLTLPTTERV